MSGGNVQAVSANTVIGNTIHSAGRIDLQGGSAVYNVVSNGGSLGVAFGAVAFANIIADGGVLNVGYGAVVVDNYIQKGGILSVGTENATVNNNTVLDGGIITVNNDAMVNNNTISANGIINLANGGTASGNMIVSGGKINIFYRGVAVKNTVYPGASITVNDGGVIEVFSGGMALSNIVNTGGNLIVSAGGSAVWNNLLGGTLTANNAYLANNIINSGGSISAFGGGIAQDTTINSGGNFYLGSNGNALRTTIGSGATLSANYATVTSVTINSGGVLDAGFGDIGTGEETTGRFITKVNNASVNAGGTLNISRGIAVGNIVNGGTVNVYEFGSLKGTTALGGTINLIGVTGVVEGVSVGNGAVLNISGGLAVGNTVLAGGVVNAIDGTVSRTLFTNGATLNVPAGANAIDNTILTGATLDVSSGGIARNNHIDAGGTIKIASGGIALNNDVASGGNFIIDDGGSAFGNVLASGANFVVNSGGNVTSNIVSSGGTISIGSGGNTEGNIITGGTIYVSSGATAFENTISEGGQIIVSAGGNALNNTIVTGGDLIVSAGGLAVGNNITGGDLIASSGAYLLGNSAINGGIISATGGGVMKDTYIASGGTVYLTNNAAASNNIIENGGTLYVDYATVTGVMVNSGGTINAGFGSGFGFRPNIVVNATINQGGMLNISKGKAAGNVINGGTVNIYDEGNLYGTQNNATSVEEDGDPTKVNAGIVNLIGSTGTVKGLEIGTDAILNVSGGYAVGNHVLSGGRVNAIGGVVSGTTISNGADLNVSVGATVANNTILSRGNLNISAGGIASDNNIAFGGTITVFSGGLALNNHLNSGANLILQSGGSAFGNTLQSGANFIVNQGALVSAGTVGSGGVMSVTDGGKLQGMTIQSGGSAVLENGAQLDGTIVLKSGGYLAITNSNGGTVSFTDTTTPLYLLRDGTVTGNLETGLVVSGMGNITTVIEGFSGKSPGNSDKIILQNIDPRDITGVVYPDADHVLFEFGLHGLGGSIMLNVIGVANFGYSLGVDANGNTTYEVCFLTGTLISMMDGVCAVENIQNGDKVIAYNPQTKETFQRKVVWVGKKTAHVRQTGLDDEAGYPVRILKDAISDNVPNKDLLVTPEHCLFFNGHFTPARMLVNGRSIYYDRSLTTYDYYHIETEQHSVIMADGMFTESYLDTGNRHSFAPEQKIVSLKGKSWSEDAAAPLVVDQAIVEPLYRQIEERACAMGCEYKVDPIQITNDADLRLITDKGQVIGDDLVSQDGKIVFIIPAHTKSVRIVSRISRPSITIGSFVDDRRYLGLLIGDMQVFCNDDTQTFNIHTQTDVLDGWDVLESELCRWTKGDALLPLDQLGDFDTPIYLSMKILNGGPYILEDHKEEAQKQSA